MDELQQSVQQNQPEHKKGEKPRYANRQERRKFLGTIFNNNRKPKNSRFINMGIARNTAVIYEPKRKKLNGYQKNRK